MSVETIVTVASWEPRFLLGLDRLLTESSPSQVLMYFYEGYASRTQEARDKAVALAEGRGIKLTPVSLTFSEPARTWRTIQADLHTQPRVFGDVLVDITTMPRDAIWSIMFWLEQSRTMVHYAYHRPEAYGDGWLARDPDEPRFVFKLAGAPLLDRPTALLAVTGYDKDRALQAIDYYEPSRIELAVQAGEQFENPTRNVAQHSLGRFDTDHVARAELDAYSGDHGYAQLLEIAGRLSREFNVVLCSFGPKPSAVALYRVQRHLKHCSLAYIHCKDYSLDYSNGIGSTVRGSFRSTAEATS